MTVEQVTKVISIGLSLEIVKPAARLCQLGPGSSSPGAWLRDVRSACGPLRPLATACLLAGWTALGALVPVGTTEAQSAPSVVSIQYISTPAIGDTYRLGENIAVRVTFDQAVRATGTALLPITIGTQMRLAFLFAAHDVHVGFRYTVQADDIDTDGISIAANALTAAGGTIKDAADGTSDAVLTHDALPADATRKVNGMESPIGVKISPQEVVVPEGETSSYAVALVSRPTAAVTITAARATGSDEDLTASPTKLTFSGTNWSTAQTVTISAVEDHDGDDGTATFTHTASSADARYDGVELAAVTATEGDDDFVHGIPLFPLSSSPNWEGFARIINRSDETGEVRIEGTDDTGASYGPVTLDLGPGQTRHFNSSDLVEGASSKGLSGELGSDATGSWRLRLVTNLDIETLAYIRTEDGFVTTMHEVAYSSPGEENIRYFVPFLNPGSNRGQRSSLRLANNTDDAVSVTITGTDDDGEPPPGGEVKLVLPAGEVRTVSSQQLESGDDGFDGSFGDGEGKWRLSLAADGPIEVMSLLESPTGHLSNLSAPGLRRVEGGLAVHPVPVFSPATNQVQQGFARIINHSGESGTARIYGIDDTGVQYGPISLSMMPGATVHFNSQDLENGNPLKGLSGGLGDGEGDWRLRIHTDLDIEPLSYIRTEDGFVTSMHEVAQWTSAGYHVPFFNPGSNQMQRSRLRLINPNAASADVIISGLDDAGKAPSGGEVSLTIPAGGARTVTARELESGGDGLNGRFGDGTGKWQLFVFADTPITVVSVLESPTGHLSNLSAGPGRTTTPLPPTGIVAWISSPQLIGNAFLTTEDTLDIEVQVSEAVVTAALLNDRTPGQRTATPADGVVTFEDVPLEIGDNAMTVTVHDRFSATVELNLTVIRTRLVSFDSALDLSETAVPTGSLESVTARIALTNLAPGEPIEVDLVHVDTSGSVVEELTELADEGDVDDGDDVPGDGVYSGKFTVPTDAEGEFLVRVRAQRGGIVDYSEVVVLSVIDPFTEDEIAAATAAVDAAVGAEEAKGTVELTASELRAVKENIVNEFASMEGVASSQLAEDGRMILTEFESGLNYALLFVEEDAAGESVKQGTGAESRHDPDAATTPAPSLDFYVNSSRPSSLAGRPDGSSPKTANSGTAAGKDVIGASTALFLGPFEASFGSRDETNFVYPSVQASTTPSFDSIVREINHDVTVEDFKRFEDYGITVLSSHGGVASGTVFVSTGQEATAALQTQYTKDIAANRLWVGQSVNVRRTGFWSILWSTKQAPGFLIAPNFIRRYNQNIPNSLVIISTCKGLINGTMASAFLAGGAAAYLGFTDTVGSTFAADSVKHFVDRMIAGDTVQEALASTHSTIGVAEQDSTPASLVFRGNGSLKLDGVGLLNGSFEENLLHWVGNGGDIRILTRLSNVRPTDGSRFVVLSSGLGSINDSEAILHQNFVVPSDASTLSFSYNVLSEEPHEYIGSQFDDQFEAHLFSGDEFTASDLIASESVNKSSWTRIFGVDSDGGLFPGGDGTAYQTGLKNVNFNVQSLRGNHVRLRFRVFDRGDSIYDTAVVVDNIQVN